MHNRLASKYIKTIDLIFFDLFIRNNSLKNIKEEKITYPNIIFVIAKYDRNNDEINNNFQLIFSF